MNNFIHNILYNNTPLCTDIIELINEYNSYDIHTDICKISNNVHVLYSNVYLDMAQWIATWKHDTDYCIINFPYKEFNKYNFLVHQNIIQCACILPNNQLACGTEGNLIYVWDIISGNINYKLQIKDNYPVNLHYNNNKIISVLIDDTIQIWDINSKQSITNIKIEDKNNLCINNSILFNNTLVCSDWNKLYVINTDSKNIKKEKFLGINENLEITCMCKLSNNRLALGVGMVFYWAKSDVNLEDGEIMILIWNFKNNSRFSLIGHTKDITHILNLPYNRIASGSLDGTVRIWDTITGDCLQLLQFDTPINSIYKTSKSQVLHVVHRSIS